MKKKNFYKGAKAITFKGAEIVKKYIEGFRLVDDGHGNSHKEPLKEGMTKYNRKLLEDANTLSREYGALMSAELALLALVEKYAETSWGIAHNVHRILYAQKGTLGFLNALRVALKRYQVRDQDVYDALRYDVKNMQERRGRNAEFLSSFANDCGLGPLVEIVRKDFGESMFECTMRVIDEFQSDNMMKDGETIDEYRVRIKDHYASWAEGILAEKGFDTAKLIQDREAEHKAISKEAHDRLTKDIKESKHKALMDKANGLVARNASLVMEMIRTANERGLFADFVYVTFMNHLSAVDGCGWYIAVVKKDRLTFCADADTLKLTESIVTMKLYPNKAEAEADAAKIKEAFPRAAVIIDSIVFADKVKSMKQMEGRSHTDIQKEQQTRYITNLLEDTAGISESSRMFIDNMFLFHDMKLIYIGAASRNGGYYVGRSDGGQFSLKDNLRQCTFYASMAEAEEAFAICEETVRNNDVEPFINVISFEDGLASHKKLRREWSSSIDAFMAYVSGTFRDRYDLSADMPHFAHKAHKRKFLELIDGKDTYIIMEHTDLGNHISWVQAKQRGINCDLADGVPDDLIQRTYKDRKLQNIVYASTTPEGLAAISEYFDTVCQRTAKSEFQRPAIIVKIMKQKNKYAWEMVRNNMHWE